MDITSPEFYAIAFVVAMALVALLMGRSEKKPASTHIVQLLTTPDEGGGENQLIIEVLEGGKVRLSRTGLMLADGETVNLVFTLRDGECTVEEKKGVKRRGPAIHVVQGEATVKCFRPMKYRVRYESQVTSTWATFAMDASMPGVTRVRLTY